MNKYLLSALGLLVVVSVAGLFFVNRNSSTTTPTQETITESENLQNSQPSSTSLVFDRKTIQIGDKVGAFTVIEIRSTVIIFSGTASIKGSLIYEIGGLQNYYLSGLSSAEQLMKFPHEKTVTFGKTLVIDPNGHLPPDFSTELAPGQYSTKPIPVEVGVSGFEYYIGSVQDVIPFVLEASYIQKI